MLKFTRKVLLSIFQGVTPMTSLNLETMSVSEMGCDTAASSGRTSEQEN
jgi:hypothetical protein